MNKSAKSKSLRPAIKPVLSALALAGLMVHVLPAAAQVTIFNKPPSAAELRRALQGGAPAAMPAPTAPQAAPQAGDLLRPSGVRTRGIVWKQQGLPANNAQPSAAARTANAPTEQALGYSGSAPAAGMPINFAAGSARVEPDSYGFIRSVAEVLQTDPGMSLVIEGHTDATGSYQRNMVLSWERAMGVYRMLVEQFGIEPTRLQLQGKGPNEPLPGTSPVDGTNRRVQFRVSG